jgi:hypothetical protein
LRRLNEFWVEQGEEQNLAADPKLAGVLQQMREKLEGYREGALMRTPGAVVARNLFPYSSSQGHSLLDLASLALYVYKNIHKS